VHDFGYLPLRPSEGCRQTGRLAHSPGLSRRPASQLRILQLARSNWRILSRYSEEILLSEPS
jgi:hypothetical protein